MSNLSELERLSSSEAIKSFDFEKKAKLILENVGWDTIHSPFFVDVNTGKPREIDLIARRFYRKELKEKRINSDIALLIECKSISNYHLIFDGDITSSFDSETNYNIWIGYENYYRNKKLFEILNKTKLEEKDKINIIKIIEGLAFPRHTMVIGPHRPNTFNDIKKFTSFRETNIGAVKELDNSVLWKSFLSLHAACQGYELDEWASMESDLLSIVDFNSSNDMKHAIKSILYHYILTHISLHKILVVDCNLWSYSNKLEKEMYLRYIQTDVYGRKEKWIDVVNINYFEHYLAVLSNFYSSFFSKLRMKRFK